MFVWNEKKKKGEKQPARFLSKMFLLLFFSQGFCILYFEFYALRVSLYRCMKGGRLSVCSRMAPSDLGSKVDFSERSMLISMFAVTLSGIFAIAHEGSCSLVSLFLGKNVGNFVLLLLSRRPKVFKHWLRGPIRSSALVSPDDDAKWRCWRMDVGRSRRNDIFWT